MKFISPVLVTAIALLSACSSSDGGGTPSGTGGSGSGGATPTGSGGATVGTGGSGSGGTTSGSGGDVGSGGAIMDAPVADTAADVSKDAPAGETAGGFSKQFTCPAGPFVNDNIGTRKAVCVGFNYRYNYIEGPTWLASQHAFYFSNFNQGDGHFGDIIKYTPSTGTCETFLQGVGCNGLGVHANGKLIGACHLTHSIMEFDPVTKAKRTIAEGYMGKTFNSPNDLVAHSNGTIYFSNPTYESIAPAGMAFGLAAFWIDPKETVHLLAMGGSNGVALSPDEKTLYVSGMGRWALDDQGVPGARTNNDPGGDGISVNCAGKLFTPATNSCFGGDDGKTMLIVSGSGGNLHVDSVQMMVPGIP
ncbi:MAG TPA: SMP-30/gluconolactonase/LRE family protein [Polyangia bacterium]|nr:SMP-30/gluconolactonase/LRE family protein [Polyangia bacterium]